MVTIESTPQELGMLKRERSERFYFLVVNIVRTGYGLPVQPRPTIILFIVFDADVVFLVLMRKRKVVFSFAVL